MGQTQTQTTTIPGAGRQEAQLMSLLSRLANQFGGQFGDLSRLAGGQLQGPGEEDVALVQQTIGRTGEIAQREMERILGPLMAQITEGVSARGVGGSSIESLNRILGSREISGRLADIMSQAQAQGGQALMNLPFQRAEAQLGANQALFQMLTGAANPVLQGSLQSRLAQPTTTMKTPMNFGDIFSLAGQVGGLSFLPWNKQKPSSQSQGPPAYFNPMGYLRD